MIDATRKAMDTGRARYLTIKNEGITEGIAEGRSRGIEEGARQKTIELVRAAFSKGLAPETLSDLFDIGGDDVAKILAGA